MDNSYSLLVVNFIFNNSNIKKGVVMYKYIYLKHVSTETWSKQIVFKKYENYI